MRAIVPFLSLTLLVLGIFADDPHDALATDDLALRADPLDRRTYFHDEVLSSRLLQAVDDATPVEVVGRQLHEHPVAGEDADEVLPHLAGDVGEHLVLV